MIEQIAWRKFHSMLKERTGLVLGSNDQFCKDVGLDDPEKWKDAPNWETKSDIDLLKLFTIPVDVELIVISDACYTKTSGPFVVSNSETLNRFTENHFNRFSECLFNGDVLVFALERRYVGVFHHEGVYCEGFLPCSS